MFHFSAQSYPCPGSTSNIFTGSTSVPVLIVIPRQSPLCTNSFPAPRFALRHIRFRTSRPTTYLSLPSLPLCLAHSQPRRTTSRPHQPHQQSHHILHAPQQPPVPAFVQTCNSTLQSARSSRCTLRATTQVATAYPNEARGVTSAADPGSRAEAAPV
eukprot:7381280-Prymnesium_polylepis.1